MQVRLIHKMPSSVVCLVETVILPSKNVPFYAKNCNRRVTETRMPLVLFLRARPAVFTAARSIIQKPPV